MELPGRLVEATIRDIIDKIHDVMIVDARLQVRVITGVMRITNDRV